MVAATGYRLTRLASLDQRSDGLSDRSDHDSPAPHRSSSAGSNPSNLTCRTTLDRQGQNVPSVPGDDAGSVSCLSHQDTRSASHLFVSAHLIDDADDG